MKGRDVLTTFIEAINTQQFDEARQMLSGDFVMTGWTAQPHDPRGKSYTPSHDAPDYAPQVDAYTIAQSKADNPTAPLFDDWQEQRELTSREPNRQNLRDND